MRNRLLTIAAALLSLAATAQTYDLNAPFGFCTRSSRTDAASTFDCTGGGISDYSQYESFSGSKITLKSTGQDMKATIQNAIKQNSVVVLDGSDGDFIVSENIGITNSNRTVLGINGARIYVSGSNLFNIAPKWKCSDPDGRGRGGMMMRTYTVGLSISL